MTPFGTFCFKSSIRNHVCSRNFSVLLSDLLKNREGCEAIMDDIIVYGKSAEEHEENLQNTFQVIMESGLNLDKEKCEIKKHKLTYVGHVLSAEGVSPDPEEGEGNYSASSANQCARTMQTDWHD